MSKQLEKFLRAKKRGHKNSAKYQHIFNDAQIELGDYATTGVVPDNLGLPYNDYNGFPLQTWEKFHNPLGISGRYYETVFENNLLIDETINNEYLGKTLSYFYYSLASQFQGVKFFPKRFGRERHNAIAADKLFNLANAILLGLEKPTEHLFNLAIHCYPRYCINSLYSCFNDFIILLTARSRGYELRFTRIESKFAFPYQDIIDQWNSNDEAVIESALLHLCDEQVKQVASPPSAGYFEFDNMNWQFYPYAALLLMKLRLNSGLSNPTVIHPAFGELNCLLPNELTELPMDETLTAVVNRMKMQGFDEDEVFSLTNLP